MKVQNTQHFENFSIIQNNPSGASRRLPLQRGLWFLRDAKSEISRQAEGFGPSGAGKFAGEGGGRRPSGGAGPAGFAH